MKAMKVAVINEAFYFFRAPIVLGEHPKLIKNFIGGFYKKEEKHLKEN